MTEKEKMLAGKVYDPTDEELKLMAHKCSIGCKGSKGSAKVLHEEDMYKIYKAAL